MLGNGTSISIYFSLLLYLASLPLGTLSKKGLEKLVSWLKDFLKDYLKKSFKKGFYKSLIKFGITYIGVFIVVLHPFGQNISVYVGAAIFIFVLAWTLISLIKKLPMFFKIFGHFCKTRSLYKTAILTIDDNWDNILNDELINSKGIVVKNLLKVLKTHFDATKLENLYNKGKKQGAKLASTFDDLPELKDVFYSILKYVVSFIIKYVVLFGIYLLVLNFLQPFILETFSGLSKWQVILLPFVQIKDAFILLFNNL